VAASQTATASAEIGLGGSGKARQGFPVSAVVGIVAALLVIITVIVVWRLVRGKMESEISQSSIGSGDGVLEFQNAQGQEQSVLRESLLGFDQAGDVPRADPRVMAERDLWGFRLIE
jgi:hypothetical protein